MEEHLRLIYSGKKDDRIIIANCPHCKSVMIPVKGNKFEYKCFECNVIWRIELIFKSRFKIEIKKTDLDEFFEWLDSLPNYWKSQKEFIEWCEKDL